MKFVVGLVSRVALGALGVFLTVELSNLLAPSKEGSGSGSLPYVNIRHLRDGLAALTVGY